MNACTNTLENEHLEVTEGNLIFHINTKEKTASVIGINKICQILSIPKSVIYNKKDFIITKISNGSFNHAFGIHTLIFPQDSELLTFESNSISYSLLISITIPGSVCELQNGWCKGLSSLRYVTVMPNNKYFKNYDYNIVVGKSDINNDEFDVLVFVNRDIKTITIPSNIKILSSYAFSSSSLENIIIPSQVTEIKEGCFSFCSNLQNIEFTPNSKLQIIEREALSYTKIEHFIIPSNLCKLKKGWCINTNGLKNVTVMPNNKYFKNFDNNTVVGKSDINNDEFDVLVFVNRDIKTITIPSNIKILSSYAFSSSSLENIIIPSQVTEIKEGCFSFCSNLQNIEFTPNSKLQIIEREAFSYSNINKFSISKHVQKISEFSFFCCSELQNIEIPDNSELQIIEKDAFASSMIENIIIPSSLIELKNGWCYRTPNLKQVRIKPNNNYFITFNENLILGKSDLNSEEYDSLIFVNRNIQTVTIPSFIKQISSCAFSYSSIEIISISHHITHICESSFLACSKLRYINIPTDSKLQYIGEKAFSSTSFESIIIPSQVKYIGKDCFLFCKLKIIEVCNFFVIKLLDTSLFDDLIIFSPSDSLTINEKT